MTDAYCAPHWIAKIRKHDGSLLKVEGTYIEWDAGASDGVMIDGYISMRELRELADYIEHNREVGSAVRE